MISCPTGDDLVRFVDGALSVEETERLEEHVGLCNRCREQRELLQTLIADVRAPIVATLDVEAHRRVVMERLDRPSAVKFRPQRRWVFAGAASAAACALAVYFGIRAPSARDTWQARGGSVEATIARDISVRPCAVDGGLQPLASGATIDSDTPLTATFRNLGTAPVYLLLFGVDARHVVHWIAPRHTRPDENPVATTLPISIRENVLDTTVVLEDVSPGPLHIVAVIASAPVHVSDVESMEGDEIDGARLARRFPRATDIRETVVEVSDAKSGGWR
jgi:hypothetical protein